MTEPTKVICPVCKQEFQQKVAWQKYDTVKCRNKYHWRWKKNILNKYREILKQDLETKETPNQT